MRVAVLLPGEAEAAPVAGRVALAHAISRSLWFDNKTGRTRRPVFVFLRKLQTGTTDAVLIFL